MDGHRTVNTPLSQEFAARPIPQEGNPPRGAEAAIFLCAKESEMRANL